VQARPRNELFQKLKPCCVKASRLAIQEPENPSAQRELVDLTRQILTTLQENKSALDEKLAEYSSFPLYSIFRQLDSFPTLVVENSVRCLNVLIAHGWKGKIPPKMVPQVLSFLTFVVDGVPGSEMKRDVPEELVLECFRGLTALFSVLAMSPTAATALAEQDAIPALGHGLTVLLDGISKGKTEHIQQEALGALETLFSGFRDQEALANFLPGTISTLAKVLSTPAHYKRAVIAKCISSTGIVVSKVLGDLQTRSIQAKATNDETPDSEKNKLLSPAWLRATTGQVKLALSGIMKLRTSDSREVRVALCSLCVKLLDECHTTLVDCAPFLIETAMILDESEQKASLTETSLRDLINIYPELGDKAKAAVYNWMSSLPREMQSSDEDAKRVALHNIAKGIRLLQELHIESSILEDTISSMLRDSTVALMTGSKPPSQASGPEIVPIDASSSVVLAGSESSYQPIVLAHQSQRELRKEMLNLLSVIGSHTKSSVLAANMLEQIRQPGSSGKVAAFWMCFELVKAAQASSAEADAFLDLSAMVGQKEDIDEVFQDLYSSSVEILDKHAEVEATNWQLEALAMEVTSYAASRSGESFRPELIDVLFPIVTFMGSEKPELRQHAIVALNEIAASCGYGNVSTLIIDNVDYMVNSVALRLNSLDISPASTQVLIMMIRLTGPRLVPFLDDVVESIFAALENYHGYPLFVESLFTVLKELVDQSVKSDKLLLEDQKKAGPKHKKTRPRPEGYKGLLQFLERRTKRIKYEEEELRTKKASQGHPAEPWRDEEQENKDEHSGDPPPEPEKPPNTVTYQLLLRITALTQHYLTSPRPKLRRALLELLSTASSALAADEEAFLPLINAAWPVIVERLYDEEAFVGIEACHTLSALCEAAGDFLASRFKTEWYDNLRRWCWKLKRQVLARPDQTRPPKASSSLRRDDKIMIPSATGALVEAKMSETKSTSGQLGYSYPVRRWEAIVSLLTTLVSHVRLDDEMFDDILELLGDTIETSREVREALELVNADAVWLARYDRGFIEPLPTPEFEEVTFTPMRGAA